MAASPSSGKMTTWSNLSGGKHRSDSEYAAEQQQQQQQPGDRDSRARRKEENTINNNEDSTGSGGSRKSRSLPDMARDSNRRTEEGTDGRLVSAFIRNKGGDRLSWNEEEEGGPIPMMRSKDTVNQYLKSQVGAAASGGAVAASGGNRLTSIQEDASTPGSGSSNVDTPTTATASPSKSSSKRFPDLNFLQDDVGLWDAFFLHSKNSSKFHSVLGKQQQQQQQQQSDGSQPPPLPVEEYLRRQTGRPQSAYSIQDLESLRTLLPQAQKHLLPQATTPSSESKGPLTQVCQSLSRLNIHNSNDAQNEAIKEMFNQQQQQQNQRSPPDGASMPQVVRVKEAWAPQGEKMEAEVVLRRRRKSRPTSKHEDELNLINNNCDEASGDSREQLMAKRRSYHPTDHLSRALNTSGSGGVSKSSGGVSRRMRRRAEFPKVGQ